MLGTKLQKEHLDIQVDCRAHYNVWRWNLGAKQKRKKLEVISWNGFLAEKLLEHAGNERIREIIGEKETILDTIDSKFLTWYSQP